MRIEQHKRRTANKERDGKIERDRKEVWDHCTPVPVARLPSEDEWVKVSQEQQ